MTFNFAAIDPSIAAMYRSAFATSRQAFVSFAEPSATE